MTPEIMHVLSHAAGLDDALRSAAVAVGWRRHFSAAPDHANYAACSEAVEAGLMTHHAATGCFFVTDAGLDVVRAEYERRRPPTWEVVVRDGGRTYPPTRVFARTRGAARARVAYSICDGLGLRFGEALRHIVSVRRV